MYFSVPVTKVGAEEGMTAGAGCCVGDVFDPMDWDEVPGEMDKFLAWLNAELRSGLMSSAELAARASHKFVSLQPAHGAPWLRPDPSTVPKIKTPCSWKSSPPMRV
ncbi:hypothetical protein GPALN_002101 [Globodera pallida]|nr:hypothetical protein GPALN_002101 [Globodera pallida]